jgi:tetratricopeptide (TPR) repeat protein
LRERGELERALAEADVAVDRLGGARPLLPLAVATRARALTALGRHEEALASSTEALSLGDELGTIEEGDAVVRLAHVEALAALGRDAAAAQARDQAKKQLISRANRISDPNRRQRFLRDIPDHARTMKS